MRRLCVSKRRWLMLPIETKSREFYGKMLLACFAAERGYGVIIGSKASTKEGRDVFPRGIFIDKSIVPGSIKDIKKTLSAGHRLSAWCEEGLIYFNPDDYRQRRIEPESFDALDYFFTWGAKQAEDIVTELKRGMDKLIISGNPRFDLLRPEFRKIFYPGAEKVCNRYGKTILLNTKFATLNSANPEARRDPIAYLKTTGRIQNDSQEKLFQKVIQLQKKVMPLFLQLISQLSKAFPGHTIIVRPHPSESDDPWVKAAKGLPNVRVIHEGNVNEWILASEVTIQNNCTTGVEAFLLEKPAISYRPYKNEEAEFKLPNSVGFEANNAEELIMLIKSIIKSDITLKDHYAEKLEFAKYYIANIDGKPACETIMDTLDKLSLPESEGIFPVRKKGILNYLKDLKKRLFPPATKKFPGLALDEMEKLLDEFKKISGRFSDVTVAQVDVHGFCVYKP